MVSELKSMKIVEQVTNRNIESLEEAKLNECLVNNLKREIKKVLH